MNPWNSDPSFNKITSTYFRDLIDLSGNLIIRNGTIRSPANTIEFDDTYSFINFLNSVNIYGQQKLTYNAIEYDVGLQCEKVDTLVTDVGTISSIVYDTQYKTTGFYWNAGLSSTIFLNNVSFPNSSISSTAIDNTSFVSKSGAETIDGIKTFNSPPVMSGASITNGTIASAKITGTACNLNSIQTLTGTKTFSVVQNFTSNLRLDGSLLVGTAGGTIITNAQLMLIPNISTLNTKTTNQTYSSLTNQTAFSNLLEFTGTLNGFSVTNFNNAITQTLGLTSPAQSQLTTNANNISTATTNITTLTNKLTNVSFTTPTTLITGTTETNVLKFNTSLNGMTTTIFSYLTTVSSDVQSQLNTLTTNSVTLSANNIFTGLCQFSNNLQLNSALVIKTPSTSVTLSNDNLTRIQYLSNVSSDINTSISNLNTKTTDISYSATTTTIGNTLSTATLTFSTSLNNITSTVFGYLSGVTSSIQNQLNLLSTTLATTTTTANEAKQRTTDIEFSDLGGNQTTISNKCNLSEVQFTTDLNDITPTTFSYLQGVSSSIQTQIDSKTSIPTGTIIMSVGDSLQNSQPLVWLKCNGQAVSRTTYVNLYQYILSRYGSGDGSTTFNVPNFQACFLRGGMYFPETERVVNGVTYTPNGPLTIQQDSMEAHVHSTNLTGTYLNSSTTNGTHFTGGLSRYNTTSFPNFTGGVSTSHRTSPETRPLNHSIYYYIKT